MGFIVGHLLTKKCCGADLHVLSLSNLMMSIQYSILFHLAHVHTCTIQAMLVQGYCILIMPYDWEQLFWWYKCQHWVPLLYDLPTSTIINYWLKYFPCHYWGGSHLRLGIDTFLQGKESIHIQMGPSRHNFNF